MAIKFRTAALNDVAPLVELVNAAYRPGPQSAAWTHESGLLEGTRINASQMLETLQAPNSVVLVAISDDDAVIACVQVAQQGGDAYIGMLSVLPGLQTAGHGKAVLGYAEKYAVENMGSKKFVMTVISSRHELIDFYLRRGYVRTGEVSDFPTDAGVGTSKVGRITFDKLEKTV